MSICIHNCQSNLAAYVKKAVKAITDVKKSKKATADVKQLKVAVGVWIDPIFEPLKW